MSQPLFDDLVQGCPEALPLPEQAWADTGACERAAEMLVALFEENHGRQLEDKE